MTHHEGRPHRITICWQSEEDDYNPGRGRYVGTTADGRQFWITTPFHWSTFKDELAGRDFVALYLWDRDGAFLSASFKQTATRSEGAALPGNNLDASAYADGITDLLESLGVVEFCDIRVAPFQFELNGVSFGLVAKPPEEDDEDDDDEDDDDEDDDDEDDEEGWRVSAEPGDYMCFYPPWDGEYDT